MNKIFSFALIFGAALSFVACSPSEEDDIFSQSAAERLNAASELYSQRLTASPNGWAMQLYPTTDNEAPYGNGYLLMLRFHKNHTVDAAMQNDLTGKAYRTDSSTWQIITDDGPVLSFNTYNNVIHTFSNPEDVPSTGTPEDPNNETGTGIGGDYEFIIVDAPEDASYMMLKGKKRGTYNLLTPVEVGVDYQAFLADVSSFQNTMFASDAPTFNVVHFGDSIYKMEGANDGIPNIYPYDQDAILHESFNPFLITKVGEDYYLRFRDAKTYGDVTVQNFKYVTDKDVFESVDNASYYISGDDPLRFFNQSLTEKKNTWAALTAYDRSESFNTLIENVISELKARKLTFTRFGMRMNEDGTLSVFVTYRNSMNYTSNIYYTYNYAKDDTGLTLTYVGPDASNASAGENLLNVAPSIKTLLETLSQKFKVVPATTGFNLKYIKLISDSDENSWFVMNLIS